MTAQVRIHTGMGPILLALETEKAPKTAANFLRYVDEAFYDGTIFHRVIKGFMIQGGGMTEDMIPKPTQAPIQNEANNGLLNKAGSIAMARTSDPHSATAQFFINLVDNAFLDFPGGDGWGYCVFGQVVEGMEVVKRIGEVETGRAHGHRDVPVEPIRIDRAERVEATEPAA